MLTVTSPEDEGPTKVDDPVLISPSTSQRPSFIPMPDANSRISSISAGADISGSSRRVSNETSRRESRDSTPELKEVDVTQSANASVTNINNRAVHLRTPSMEAEGADATAADIVSTAPSKEFGPKHPETERGIFSGTERGETSKEIDSDVDSDEEADEFPIAGLDGDLKLRASLAYLEDYTPPVIEIETLKN